MDGWKADGDGLVLLELLAGSQGSWDPQLCLASWGLGTSWAPGNSSAWEHPRAWGHPRLHGSPPGLRGFPCAGQRGHRREGRAGTDRFVSALPLGTEAAPLPKQGFGLGVVLMAELNQKVLFEFRSVLL